MTKVLVTGGTGFIGSRFISKLSNVTIAAPTRQDIDFASNNLFNEISKFLPVDYVFHFASTTHNYHLLADTSLDVRTNILGLIQFLDVVKLLSPMTRFVNIGTFFAEEPKALYGATKLCAKHICNTYRRAFDLNTVTISLPNVFGPGESGSKKKGALNWMLQRIANNEDIEVYGTEYKRQLIYIDDVIKEIINYGFSNKSIDFNIRTKPIKLDTFLLDAIRLANSSSKLHYIDTPDFHKRVGIKDWTKGFSYSQVKQTNLHEGIRRTIDYYRE